MKRCLLLANLYADFQILRQIAIACYNLATSVPPEKAAEKKEISPPQVASQVGETNGESSKNVLLKEKLQRILSKDLEALSFLLQVTQMKPGGHRMHIFAQLYSNPIEYQSIITYMTVLGKKFEKELEFIIFSQKGLKGRIVLENRDYEQLPLGVNKIYSVFVPHTKAVYLYHMKDYKGTRSGPYYGPAMYEVVRSSGIWESIKVVPTQQDARKMVRICAKFDLKGECISLRKADYNLENIKPRNREIYSSTWDEEKFICWGENGRRNVCKRKGLPLRDDWERTYKDCLDHFYCKINGSSNWPCFRGNDWTWRVRSMVIPRGLTVKVYQDSSALNKEHLLNMRDWYGPYTGPQVAAELQPFASKFQIRNTPPSQLQIRLCTKPNLKGECGEVTIDQRKAEEGGQTIDVTHGINKIPFHMRELFDQPWHNMGYRPDNTQLRSIKVPDGYRVFKSSGEKDNPDVNTLSDYMADVAVEESGKKMFKLTVEKKPETGFKSAKEKEDNEDNNF